MATVSSGGAVLPKDTAQTEGDGQKQVIESILSQGSRGLTHCQGRGKGECLEMGSGVAQRAPAERRTRARAVRTVGDEIHLLHEGVGWCLHRTPLRKTKTGEKEKVG